MTVAEFKARLVRTYLSMQRLEPGWGIPELWAAIRALPDTSRLAYLPAEMRALFESELSKCTDYRPTKPTQPHHPRKRKS